MDANQIYSQLRQILGAHKREIENLQDEIRKIRDVARGPASEIDKIPGRRVSYVLVGSQTFTTSQDGARGNAINMTVSQDGPFIWTHYPFVLWRPSLPSNATNLGRWRPVYTTPLPVETVTTEVVDLSYEIFDGGSDRALQNAAVPPLVSGPMMVHALPTPTIFAPNSTVQFVPTYHNVLFNASTAATEGTLVVAFPGFRVINM